MKKHLKLSLAILVMATLFGFGFVQTRGIISRGNVTIPTGSSLIIGSTTLSETDLASTDGTTATPTEINTAADLSVNGGLVRVKKIAISANFTAGEKDTGWDLPAKAIVLDVFVDVTTADAGETLDVGLLSSESGGDADGFLDGISVNATGIQRPGVALDGGSAYYDTTLRGVLLRNFVQGAGTDDRGLYNSKPFMTDSVTAKSVSYTGSNGTSNTMRGAIYIVYVELG